MSQTTTFHEDITNWMKVDSSDSGYQLLTDKEIIQQVGTDMEDDDNQDEPTTTISSGQAAGMLEHCLKWYE